MQKANIRLAVFSKQFILSQNVRYFNVAVTILRKYPQNHLADQILLYSISNDLLILSGHKHFIRMSEYIKRRIAWDFPSFVYTYTKNPIPDHLLILLFEYFCMKKSSEKCHKDVAQNCNFENYRNKTYHNIKWKLLPRNNKILLAKHKNQRHKKRNLYVRFQLIKSKNIIKTSFANIMLNISMHIPCENVSRAATAGQYKVFFLLKKRREGIVYVL